MLLNFIVNLATKMEAKSGELLPMQRAICVHICIIYKYTVSQNVNGFQTKHYFSLATAAMVI